ncbi:MAG: hypothetical protein ACRCX8_06410 [Sarcina sp.]
MKITTDVLITKVDVKKKKEGGEQYLMISVLDMTSGDIFDILEKDMEFLVKLHAMKKYTLELELTSNKYGLRLAIFDVKKEVGGI